MLVSKVHQDDLDCRDCTEHRAKMEFRAETAVQDFLGWREILGQVGGEETLVLLELMEFLARMELKAMLV